MRRRLEGRRIVLTGVSRGVGYETAKRVLQEGARVLGVSRDAARLAKVAESLGVLGDFVAVRADLADASAPSLVASAVRERWGSLDVLMNNAAIMVSGGEHASFEDEPDRAFERSLEENLVAPYRLSAACP